MKRVGKLKNIAQYQIIAGVCLRASSNLAKLALLVWISNFACELYAIEPTNEEIYIQKANIHSKRDEHEKAIEFLKIALKYSSGKIILLCDGDDKFYRNKVEIISGYVKNENDIFFHDFKISKNNKTYLIKNKSYKLNYLIKKFFNSWPEKISTSAIVISKKNLNNFFKTHQISEFKFLAIDALLGVFFLNKIKFIKKILMIKNEDYKNRVDLYYVNNLKNYINRRIEQHEYYSSIYNENKKIEYIILRFINYFLIF